MAGGQEKWYFTKEQIQNSPSRKCGLDADKELAYRQQAANLIQDMGQRLQVSQLCINTAIVYMHRFYAFHSFTQFHRNAIAAAALFLAAKVEEQPRKLEYVIKVAHVCLHRGEGVNALSNEQYQEQAQDLVFNENVLLQTLGFDVAIDHPHTHVVRTCHLVKAPKDLAQTSYFMASNSLHLTTMCLQYRPTVVACFCIHLASKWSNWAIPQSSEGRHWFSYVDRSVTSELLERLTAEFLHIFDKCPSRLKRKMTMMSNSGSSPNTPIPSSSASSSFDKKLVPPSADDFDKSFDKEYERERRRQPVPGGYVPATATASQPSLPPPQKIDYNVYREKREREERERREERQRQIQRSNAAQQARAGSSGQSQTQGPSQSANQGSTQGSSQGSSQSSSQGSSQAQSHSHRAVPHHHKPHGWPHHKHAATHKPQPQPHEHRHHRPPSTSQAAIPTGSATQPPIIPPQTHQEAIPQRTRPPSLFSPENVTTPAAPRRQPPSGGIAHQPRPKPEVRPQERPPERPPSPKKRPDPSVAIRDMQQPAILSPFSSPPPVKEQKPRQRQQSITEPELVPVVKKIEETPGYENVIRDSQRGNSIKAKQPEIKVEKKENPPRSLNGIETDPTLVSNLLKESLAKPAPITVATEKREPVEIKKEPVVELPPPQIVPVPEPPPVPTEEVEHKHKKEKKKKEKHKHKDRDKSKEERKKHKKDKEREKKKDPTPPPAEPTDGTLRITIPREKLSASPGLKIKIPKERLAAPPPPPQGSGLKIKISKDVLDASRKRAPPPEQGPPAKMQRQNGSHTKVGDPTVGNGHGK